MSKELIGLILTGIGALFIIFGVLVNMIRGFKKSWIRAVILVCIALVAMFITPLFSTLAGNINISNLNLTVEGQTASTVKEYITLMLSNQAELGDLINTNPDLVDLIVKLASVIINIILFGIIFWVLKIISWIIYAIVMACTVDKPRREAKKHNKKIKKETKKGLTPSGELIPVPKKIWWGGLLVGIFTGLFVGVLTLMPVVQISKIAVSLNEYKVTNSNNEEVGLIEGLTTIDNNSNAKSETTTYSEVNNSNQSKENQLMNYLYSFEDSAICKMYRYTGFEGISSLPFNYVTSFKVNNTTFKLKQEVLNIGKIAQGALNISKVDFKKATKEELDNVLTIANEVSKNAFNLTIVNVVGDSVIPYYLNKIDKGEIDLKIEDEIIADSIKDLAKEYKTVTMSQLKADVSVMIESVKILNNGDVLVNYINAEDKTTVINKISATTIDNFIDKIFEMETVTKATPVLVNLGVQMLGKELSIDVEKNTETVEKDSVKSSMTTLLKNCVDFYKSIDKNDKFYVTENSFDSLGNVLNEIKNSPLITTNTYNNIINKLVVIVNEKVDAQNIDTSLKTSIKTSVSKLKNVTDWKQETTVLKNSFTHVKVMFGEEFNQDSIINNIVVLGKLLDSLKTGTVITDSDIKSITKSVINELIPQGTSDQITNIIIDAKNRVDNIPTTKDAYEIEFGYVKILLDRIDDFKDVQDSADLTREVLVQIGKTFDSIKPSILFGDCGVKVFEYLVDQIDTTKNPEYESAVLALKARIKAFDPEKETYESLFVEIATIKETIDTFNEFSNKDIEDVTSEDVDKLVGAISSLENLEIMKYIPDGKDIGDEVVKEGLDIVKNTYSTKDPVKATEIQNVIENMDSYIDNTADNFTDKYKALFDEFKSIVVNP